MNIQISMIMVFTLPDETPDHTDLDEHLILFRLLYEPVLVMSRKRTMHPLIQIIYSTC